MRRYLPLIIIGAVLLVSVAGGWMLFRSKQSTSAPTAPIPPMVPVVPAASPTPALSVEPVSSATPVASTAQTPPATASTPAIPESESLHVRGGATAPVTLEEYGDFQCIPCSEFFPVLAQAEEIYGDKLRVVFRHRPLRKHVHAVLAARAAEAAGLQGRFWEMHDLLFQNSLRWLKGVETVGADAPPSRRLQSSLLAMDIEVRDVFASYAERLKLDVERFKKDIDSDEVKARVDADTARGDSLGIDRTPTIYINGRLIPYALVRSINDLQSKIEEELRPKAHLETGPSTPAPASPK